MYDCRLTSRILAWLVAATATLYLPVFMFGQLSPLRVPLALAVPVFSAGVVVASWRLFRRSPYPLPLGALLVGAFYIVGGVAFDMVATYLKTPTLEREGNPIARTLLDEAGWSVSAVIAFGLVAQGLLSILLVLLWGGFLKHRCVLLDSVARANSTAALDLIKAGMGGGNLTWRQIFFPLKSSELPRVYQYVWMGTVLVLGMWTFRWSLGFAWFGWVPWSWTKVISILTLVLGGVAYFYWLVSSARAIVNRKSSVVN